MSHASADAQAVLCCFFVDPRQVEPHPFRGTNSLQFMLEALKELSTSIEERGGEFCLLYGEPKEVLRKLIPQEGIEAIYFNRDYTPFARNRDRRVNEVCAELGCAVHQFGDALLQEPEAVQRKSGGPYSVYTPFAKCAAQSEVSRPSLMRVENLVKPNSDIGCGDVMPNISESWDMLSQALGKPNPLLFARGGRSHALATLERIGDFEQYHTQRDNPSEAATTGLSAHHKFGTISVRESYWKIADNFNAEHTLIRELYWRDFFTHIAFHFPKVFSGAFHSKYDSLEWENNEELFSAWCAGQTGFPIVDAGMRQLNVTGFMHNRVRMIVASFLTKDLLIDWRWGERYFATKLVDYDPAVNNGGWQWAASTGCDAQPYFRIFNPWLQQKRFDEDAKYVKRWIPELKEQPAQRLHKLHESPLLGSLYPTPIVEHAEQKARAIRLFSLDANSAESDEAS